MATKVKLIADGIVTADQLTLTTASTGTNTTAPATTAFVQQEVAALVDSSPDALNTLNELAAALGDDANFSTTVTNSIATKLPLAGGTVTGVTTFTGGDGVVVQTASDTFLQLKTTGSGSNYIEFKDSGGAAGNIRYNHSTNVLSVKTNGTDNRLVIDSSGNLLVGKTSNTLSLAGAKLGTGGSNFTRDSNEVVYVNRTTNDGSLITLAKDGTTVGKIGTQGGEICINQGSVGIRLRETAGTLIPINASRTNLDNTLDLGSSSARFKDLYLSGGVRGTSTIDITVPETAGAAIKLEFGNNVNDTRRTVQAYKDNFEPAAADTGVIGLGQATNKWKDLHLSGTANAAGFSAGSGGALVGRVGRSLTSNSLANVNFYDSGAGTFPGHVHIVANSSQADDTYQSGEIRFWHYTGSAYSTIAAFNKHGGLAFGTDQAAANTLDDYEEGTWTPDLRNGTTSLSTQTWQFGPQATYTKIGDMVFIHLSGKLSSVAGTGSGELRIFGLPFTPQTTGGYQEYRLSMIMGNQPTASHSNSLFAFARDGGNDFGCRILDGGDTVFRSNMIDSDTFFTIYGFYKT